MVHRIKDKGRVSVVRAFGQFGPLPKPPVSFRVFLDDVRNPPLKEKGWVVIRTIADGIDLIQRQGNLITAFSLDNDLGADPQGIELLRWVLAHREILPSLHTVTIHTGNMIKWRMMIRLLRGSGLKVIRRVPSDRIYPTTSNDKRSVICYKGLR